ncbi:MAG: hypothetical protein DI534_11950 [Leifsonia xyli]|nr:MAG: hypothetical protein DI534_11950 [Leifsonia xyli]
MSRAEFELALAAARRGVLVSDTGASDAVDAALADVARAPLGAEQDAAVVSAWAAFRVDGGGV